jgi:3',5'-nucleoside bisphosphate phosphatase
MPENHTCDLHMHTYYSDGRSSPAEVVRQSASLGLKTIAITDHDNGRGSREARPIADQFGVELIPAVELTTSWPGVDNDVDLLGYYVDMDAPEFAALEKASLDDIHDRIRECCERLTAAGYPVSFDQLREEYPHYTGGGHVIFYLRGKFGMDSAPPPGKVFIDQWHLVRASYLTTERAIQAIKDLGGAAVLAHPSIVRHQEPLTEADIAALVEMGLDGIEVHHYRLDSAAREYFGTLARTFDLVITGGSDEHGWSDGTSRLGCEPITHEMVTALRERAGT